MNDAVEHFQSPLWMVTQEPSLHELVTTLSQLRQDILDRPGERHVLLLSHDQLAEIRQAFSRTLLRGERRLHRLCDLLCQELLDEACALQSVVIGETLNNGERFTLIQDLSAEDLSSTTDLDLGTRQLLRLRMHDGHTWAMPSLVANFVEYQPLSAEPYGIHKLISRIKAEEELWNKVVDEIFHLDALVLRDKQLAHLSRYVKDVFGVKIVVDNVGQARALQHRLERLHFDEERLVAAEIEPMASTRRPAVLEVKDYLSTDSRKQSGWAAIKMVLWWWETSVEIQLMPLAIYLRERERLTRESHASFKARRDDLREQIAAQLPLFRYYRDLLRWLFLDPGGPAPAFDGLDVLVG